VLPHIDRLVCVWMDYQLTTWLENLLVIQDKPKVYAA
jgi:hypothetical protein